MNKEYRLSDYDETIRAVLDSGGEFRIYPKGTSMLPLIRMGADSVSLAKCTGLKRGDIAFYLRDNGEYVLHRVIKAEKGFYTMCGDNQLTPEKGISDRHIIGRAVKIYRGEKLIPCDSFPYRLYVFFWRSFFVRRVFFKFRSVFRKVRKQK